MKFDRDKLPILIAVVTIVLILSIGLFTPVRSRLAFQVEKLKNRLYYLSNPPGKEVFVPVGGTRETVTLPAPVETLMIVPVEPTEILAPTTDLATVAAASTTTIVPAATLTPQATETMAPLPATFNLTGVKYEDQHGVWNYCAPTNLSMALTYWGWDGDRLEAGKWLKPIEKDKNVMFYEMEQFVLQNTGLRSIVRGGGTPTLLKRLIVSGFPVLIEKGAFIQDLNGKLSWMGHYNLVTGYDDASQEWIVQDSYYQPNFRIKYEKIDSEWRSFNYEFMVVYPGDREAELYSILGPYTNEQWTKENALKMADEQVASATDAESFFYAYFNRGSALVNLNDFYSAALSYDMAYQFYAELEQAIRPYRIVWYQTGPYYAYYYSGRYQDLINLADIALASTSEPFLEESYYWRAKANQALGMLNLVEEDVNNCLNVHPGFPPCEALKAELGM